MNYVITDIQKDNIYCIKSLWEKLNEIHLKDSIYFKDHYETFSFDERVKSFLKFKDEYIKITVIKKDNNILGYCISSIHDEKGEIESLYVSEELRNNNYGKKFVEDHIEWLKINNCKKIVVSVSYGHDSVMGFYHKMGFFERLIQLEYKQNK